jgi:ribonucleoside-triphosphate reductase
VIHLGTEQKIINVVLSAYRTYTQLTPIPTIGLIINYEKGVVSNVSEILSEIISLGGIIMFSKHRVSQKGIVHLENTSVTSLHLSSLSINLPRLAFESNKDETYFRARLVMLMKPALASMALRKKNISDLIRLGINPVLADSTQYMQRSSVSLIVNLVGLDNAVYGILGFKNDKEGKEILHKVIETALSVASKKSKEFSVNVMISMTKSDGSDRFVSLDEEKYGKDSIIKITDDQTYSQGIPLDGNTVTELTAKSTEIVECNKITKILNGCLLVPLNIPSGTKVTQIKKLIEKTASMINSFKPVMKIAVCGNCGFKGEKLVDKCPDCKSSFIV